ncbi:MULTISPECIES: ArsR/SmtB family transcription factor [Metabacillus]|uniref:Transcriptional regulator n=2 Tax=Metabacillus TaxID=2675233 RepID=A0A179T2L8_9BACI|nr:MULTISPECIES: metalloregulator ArsR/SmtB family transcription factor [Metabacillus]OAS87590.1 transcriptional regulator [Metabacillus litoralis]QNF27013.1 winged helix-turn-helix transcriptional regulator [Metabacillus sp. KUDC1714]
MTAVQKYDVFQAIADPSRRKMLKLLANQELPVTVISKHFPMSRTAVSKHLRILSEANLLSVEKVGREIRYKLQPDTLLELKDWLSFYEQFWDNKISMLRHLVENEETCGLKAVEKIDRFDNNEK